MEIWEIENDEIKILEQALKNEDIEKSIGPLNPNWFGELNERFNNEMFSESFQEKSNSNLARVSKEREQEPSTTKNTSIKDEAAAVLNHSNESGGRVFEVEESEEANLHSCSGIDGDMMKIAAQFEQEFADSIVKTRPADGKQCSVTRELSSSPKDEKSSIAFSACTEIRDGNKNSSEIPIKALDQAFMKREFGHVINSCSTSKISDTVGFTTASNKPLKCSFEALQKAKFLMDNLDASNEQIIANADLKFPSFSNFSGFKTASNKPMAISHQAMEKANAIFSSLKDNDTLDQSNKDTKTSSETKLNHNSISLAGDPRPNTFTVGFKTASNKSMAISSAALKKGQSFMNKVDESAESNPQSKENVVPPFLATSKTSLPNSNGNIALCNTNHGPNNVQNKRLSLPATSVLNSPLFKPAKAKRRNSFFVPPRKKRPLGEVNTNLTINSSSNTDGQISTAENARTSKLHCTKKQLGLKCDQEHQIFLSDESLLKAVALFEQI